MKNNKGFTLIELMVTIAVAAILISIALPSFRSIIINYRLNTISSELADAISVARSESIKRNRPITFCKAADVDSTGCTESGAWSHWLIKQNVASTNKDDVISRGRINSHNGSIKVTTSIANNRIDFATDGLARSGSVLLNKATIIVCSTSSIAEPIRNITIGAASHASITKASGEC